jgi:hypothetical protein
MEITTVALLYVVAAIVIAAGHQLAIYLLKKIEMQNRKIRLLKRYSDYLKQQIKKYEN